MDSLFGFSKSIGLLQMIKKAIASHCSEIEPADPFLTSIDLWSANHVFAL